MSEVVKEEKNIERQIWGIIDEDRVVNFSDAVFAFAATLLVLKIDLPVEVRSNMSTQLFPALATLWPQYFANIISFLIIGFYWLNHHAIFGMLKKFNSTIVWINIIFLISLSFLPFPVDLYGDYMHEPPVVVFYSASLAVVGFLLFVLWWYASSDHRLISKEMSRQTMQYFSARLLIAPIVFTVSIPLVYIHPVLAQLSWVLVIVGMIWIGKYFRGPHGSRTEQLAV